MQQSTYIDHFKICYTCFMRQARPSSGAHFHCIYGFWYNAPILLPVGGNIGALYQKLYIESKSAPEDGRVCRPKYVEQI